MQAMSEEAPLPGIPQIHPGRPEITINLQARKIRRLQQPKTILKHLWREVPACQLCLDNEGYPDGGALRSAGAHPARQNPSSLLSSPKCLLGFQHSPYAYNEHCTRTLITFQCTLITRLSISSTLCGQIPPLLIGSNADLPTGWTTLSHDHYQGGRYEFPAMRAKGRVCTRVLPEVAGYSAAAFCTSPASPTRSRVVELSSLHAP